MTRSVTCPLCENIGTIRYFGIYVCQKHWEELTGIKP